MGTSFFQEYFATDSAGNMVRECALTRRLSQTHVDSSIGDGGLRDYVVYAVQAAAAMDGTRRWPVLNTAFSDEFGGTECAGVSACETPGDAYTTCGCTDVSNTVMEAYAGTSPATLAEGYVRAVGGGSIGRNRFMQSGSLNANLELALVKYTLLDLDASGKIQLSSAIPPSLVQATRAAYPGVFQDKVCVYVDVKWSMLVVSVC